MKQIWRKSAVWNCLEPFYRFYFSTKFLYIFNLILVRFLTFFYRNEVDVTQPIRLSFKNWLDALFIAQKYKKELKADSDEQSSETTNEDGSTPTSKSLPSELGLEFDFQRLLNTASERAR